MIQLVSLSAFLIKSIKSITKSLIICLGIIGLTGFYLDFSRVA
jgi:hypothetical protein